jgi:hypothetical protein
MKEEMKTMSLTFIDNGNWGVREASQPFEGYRKGLLTWARAYNNICNHFNTTGKAWKDALPHQIDGNLMKNGVEPKPEQRELLTAMINLSRAAVFAGLGSGKTFMGGYAAIYTMKRGMLKDTPQIKNRFLIVCPKTAIGEWTSQLPQFFDCSIKVFPDDNSLNADFVVTNFEQLEKLIQYKQYFSGIIVDESQGIKNVKTNRFHNLMEFCDGNIESRFILTATPIANKPDDLFSQLSFINPYSFNFSYNYMLSRYFKEGGFGVRKKKIFLARGKDTFQFITTCNSLMIVTPTEDRLPVERDVVRHKLTSEQNEYIDTVKAGQITISL